MESESAQEEDLKLTQSIIQEDVNHGKDSCESTDRQIEHPIKSNYISSEKDTAPEMLFDTSDYIPQVGRVNGKVSEEKEEEEEDNVSVNAEELSQSSSSDDSTASSDVSSSSSDDELNSSNQNQWSSSVTNTGIKLSVRAPSIRSSEPTETPPSKRASFCEEVKSSRLSDDSSSSDEDERSESVTLNSNCNNVNSLEKDSLDVNQSPNSRHPNSTNFKDSISNFPSSNLSSFEDSNLDKSSFNISRNDRRSIDSVGSHLSQRKLSLSSDSSDSETENNHEGLVSDSTKSSLNPSVESYLFNSVKSNSTNSNNSSFKPDLIGDRFNDMSDSTCVNFNSVNTTRSPEKKIASPIKETSQDSSLLDGFSTASNSGKESQNESIPNTKNSEQNCKLSNNADQSPNSSPSFQLSNINNADQSQNSNSINNFLSNSLSRPKNIGNEDEAELTVQNSFGKTNSSVNVELSEVERSLSHPVNVMNENEEGASDSLNKVNDKSDLESEHNSDLELDFKSQDMGMEISSDSSLSSDDMSGDESGSQNNLSELSFESKNSAEEMAEPPVDIMQVVGSHDQKESPLVDVMSVIGVTSEKDTKVVAASSEDEFDESITSEKEMENVDVMEVIGVPSDQATGNVTQVIGVSDKKEPQKTIAHVMNVIGVTSVKETEDPMPANETKSEESLPDAMEVLGVASEKETRIDVRNENKSEEPMDVDVMKVIGVSDFETSKSRTDESFSILKSQLEGVSPFQKSDSIVKQSSFSVSNSEEPVLKYETNSAEDIKDDSQNGNVSGVEKPVASCSRRKESPNSSSVDEENREESDSNSNLVNRFNEEVDSVKNEELSTEPGKAQNSDNILSIISKDLKTKNGTKSLSKRKRLLLKQKKSSVKFKKKLKLLKNLNLGAGNEANKLVAQVPEGEEPIAEYAQYLGLQPTLKFKCCICAEIGFQSYPELREHQKNCQATEAGRSSACASKPTSMSFPCSNAEDINQTNFRITRKVYLCSACGTYYENWNLFLHMQEVHQRFICLLCLGMFTMSYKLSDHLILTHGIEVKSFQNLLDFRQAFNCALYVSCTDCGKTFSESDNWCSHQCLFTCNICNIKNGHLPRCPRNCFVKSDDSAGDMKLPTKCIIRINPGSCTTTTILPKRDDKSYDFASNFCSVDITEMGESSLEPSDSEKTPSRTENLSSVTEKRNPDAKAASASTQGENSEVENNSGEKCALEQVEMSSSNEAENPGENEKKISKEEKKEEKEEKEREKKMEIEKNDEVKEEVSECNNEIENENGNGSDSSGNHGNEDNQSNDEEIERRSETSDLTSESESGTEDEKCEEISGAGLQTSSDLAIIDNPSEMKLIIKKSALNNPSFKLSTKPNKTESASIDPSPREDIRKENNETGENKQNSSLFDPDDNPETRPPRSRSITSPVNCDSENPVTNPTSILRETLDFKNRLNSDSHIHDSSLPLTSESPRITEREAEGEKNNLKVSMESQASVSDDSRMDYESDSQPEPEPPGNSKVDDSTRPGEGEKVVSHSNNTNNTNNTWDSDSNRLSMAVDNNENDDSRSSTKDDTASDEKMMIDYDGDNAVDNADNSTVGQSDSNYNSLGSDEGSPLKAGSNVDGITLAAEDVGALALALSGPLDSMTLNTIVKECVRVSCTSCAYCNHALKIAVNAKELVLHLLAEHRFTPAKDEDSPKKLVSTLKNGLTSLESVFFNTDSYDSSDKSSNLPYDGTFSCFQCPFWTLQHKDLYTHKRKMHQKTILLCVMCKSNFYSYSELLCHMCPGTYQPNDILFRCCFCHMDKIPSAFRLMVHIRKIHHTCEICLDVSTDQQKLATHMWKHKLHHLCYRCGIAYRNKPDITRHLFWKHGTESVLCKKCLQKKWPHVYHFCIPPATVVCDECNAMFTRTVALRVHKRLHTNEKPHACTQCEDKFISKKILAKHEISHSVKKNESENTCADVEKKEKENYDPTPTLTKLGITDPPVQIQKTDEKQNIDVDDETVPVIRIKKNKTKKSKPMLDLTDLPPLNLSSESDSEPESGASKPAVEPVPETTTATATAEVKSETEGETEGKAQVEDKSELEAEAGNLKENLTVETEKEEEAEEKKENIVESTDNTSTDSQRLEIILADHDYCKPQSESQSDEKEKESNSENKDDKLDVSADLNSSLNATLDTKDVSEASDSSPTKRKSKSPKKKLNKSSNSSSSSSSSDTDSSSCSCGPNCSCSSSSSDSSTSTSSDSDSSNPENRRKQEERRQKRRERPKTKSPKVDPEPVISVENEEPYILESDLDTDITLTDEDFYDEYPQQHANKMLAEKQQSEKDQLMLLASVAPTHTAPSSPVVSAPEEEASAAPQPTSSLKLKKRLKTKRKRDETLVPAIAIAPSAASAPSLQSHLPFESKLSQLPSSTSTSTPPLITKLPNPNARNYMSMSMSQTPTSEHFSDRTMSTGGSGSESESKRSSKRRRTKNRFYGYSSEEENQGESSKPRFKPKKLKKVIAVRKSEPTLSLSRPNPFNVTLPVQPASIQPYQPTISIKPILPPVANVVRSTLPPVRHRPPSPFSTSDSDDDKLNIDEKYEPPQPHQAPQSHQPRHQALETPQAMLTPTLAAALAAPQQSGTAKNLYCYCQCPYDEVSEMIACDGDSCMIEWFHFECVGIMVPPKGQWFCPECRKKKNLSY